MSLVAARQAHLVDKENSTEMSAASYGKSGALAAAPKSPGRGLSPRSTNARPTAPPGGKPSGKPTGRRPAGASKQKKALSAKWLFDAALLSSPVDLTALVELSQKEPDAVLSEVGLLNRMVSTVLCKDSRRFDKDTRLDVLLVLANVAAKDCEHARERVRRVLAGVTDWFEAYLRVEEGSKGPGQDRSEPELHKTMLLLLARAYSYKLRTEDLLELCGGERKLALESVVGLLEEGEMVTTEVSQKKEATEKERAQWEQKVVSKRYEKDLIVQLCMLLKGFTHPTTYFQATDEGFYMMEAGLELPEYSVEQFACEMDALLAITMRTNLAEKMSVAMHEALFSDERILDDDDHAAVIAVHEYLQNLYTYATVNVAPFRQHLLADTLLVPHLIIPYLDRCSHHASILSRRAASNRAALGAVDMGMDELAGIIDEVADLALDHPMLTKGISASLRTLVIASFRAPKSSVMYRILEKFNPTEQLLAMPAFLSRHDAIFALMVMLNVNMGAFDIEQAAIDGDSASLLSAYQAYTRLQEVAIVYRDMPTDKRHGVIKRLEEHQALPLSRDMPSYAAVLGLLWGGGAGQLEYLIRAAEKSSGFDFDDVEGDELDGDLYADDTESDDDDDDDDAALAIDAAALAQEEAAMFDAFSLRNGGAAGAALLEEQSARVVTRLTPAAAVPELGQTLNGGLGETANFAELRNAAKKEAGGRADAGARLKALEAALALDDSSDDDDGDAPPVAFEDAATGVGALEGADATLARPGEAPGPADENFNGANVNAPPTASEAALFGSFVKTPEQAIAAANSALAEPAAKEAPAVVVDTASGAVVDDAEAAAAKEKKRERRERRKKKAKRAAAKKKKAALLGELPSLDDAVAMKHEMLGFFESAPVQKKREARPAPAGSAAAAAPRAGVPAEMACALNGHLMKDPVRTPYGHVMERETIESWIETRGQTCPLTGEGLSAIDLEAVGELRTKIMRYHIERATKATESDPFAICGTGSSASASLAPSAPTNTDGSFAIGGLCTGDRGSAAPAADDDAALYDF